MQFLRWALVMIVSYFLGNLNGAILISRAMLNDDVRTHGSGNAGLTNFFRTYGGVKTVLVIVIDIAKCVLACLLAKWLLPQWGIVAKLLAGLACIVGHSFPVLEGFRGGKGILCGLAVALTTDWRIAAVILAVFILTLILTHYVSLGSILGAAAFAVSYFFFYCGQWQVCVTAIVISVFVIARHWQNIDRLLHGTETKLFLSKKKN